MQNNKGFTLVELIVVMAILAVLASLVAVNVSGVAARGRVTRIQTDLQMLESAGDQFLYTEAERELWIGQELPQEQLLKQGLLDKTLKPPLEGYTYVVRVQADGWVQATMENGDGIYNSGEFVADTRSAQFN